MSHFKHYQDERPSGGAKVGKATLFQSDRLLLGLNTLSSGVEQRVHTHQDEDKFYHVLEGQGEFTVGTETRRAGPGETVLAPAGVPHGVRNPEEPDLILLMGMAPSP